MKRKLEKQKVEYVIIETIGSGEVFVQFVPRVWLAVLAKRKTYKPRDPAKFYYPRRLPNQSRAKHLQFLKEAKFVCTKPTNDSKWELRYCRILQLGLGTIEDAIDEEKKFMDFFSTTDAEATLKKAAESKQVKTKKPKKVPAKKASSSSESDDETAAATKISNYNDRLVNNIHNLLTSDSNNVRAENNQTNQNLFTLDRINNVILDINRTNQNVITLDAGNFICTDQPTNQNLYNTGRDDVLPHQTFFSLDDANITQPNEFLTAIPVADFDEQEMQDVDSVIPEQHANLNGCRCLQKVLNKIDYFSKKVFKEFASIREEIKSNRTSCLDRSNVHQVLEGNEDSNHEEHTVVAGDEFETFDTEYKTNFPAKNFEILLETNQSIASDESFKIFLRTKIEKHQGTDETKTVRKILKSLCDVQCLNRCTWTGTKNKDGTKKKESFVGLTALVDLIIKVIEKKFANCDAMEILKSVVQQRTKSAPEAVANLIEKSQASLQTTPIDNNHRPDIIIQQGSTTGDHTDMTSNSSIVSDTDVVDVQELNGVSRDQDDALASSS